MRLWDEDPLNLQTNGAPAAYSSANRWCPMVNIALATLAANRGLGLHFTARDSGNVSDLDDNYLNFILDMALDGNGAIPYPLAPLSSGPDELLTLTGFSLGSNHDWHVKLALMTPTGNWDWWSARGNFVGPTFVSDRRWPLFTLWKDSTHYIEFLADCEGKGFLLRVKEGGSVQEYQFCDDVVWLPDSPLFVAIGYEHATHSLFVGASLGGDPMRVYPNTITLNHASPFTALKFRGANGGYSGDGEVCELRIFGGQIDTSNALNNTSLLTAFEILGFLT